jgi:TetR/AcrR family transcriptional regulator, transcriptional repressor for nem operon
LEGDRTIVLDEVMISTEPTLPGDAGSKLASPMRVRIKTLTVELLVRHGCRGLRFADIADALGTTRATVHYHFGNKERLIEEVVEDYVAGTLERFRLTWESAGPTLVERIQGTIAFNRERYERFNGAAGGGGRAWSLIARMRLERDLLSPSARLALERFRTELDAMVTAAVAGAKEAGELTAEAPVEEIARQLVAIANSSGSITVDAGSFDVLEHLYLGFARIVDHAYGRKPVGAG